MFSNDHSLNPKDGTVDSAALYVTDQKFHIAVVIRFTSPPNLSEYGRPVVSGTDTVILASLPNPSHDISAFTGHSPFSAIAAQLE
jgi:hypothetical protein